MTKPTNKPKEPEWIENLENLDSPSVEELKNFINSLLKDFGQEMYNNKHNPVRLILIQNKWTY